MSLQFIGMFVMFIGFCGMAFMPIIQRFELFSYRGQIIWTVVSYSVFFIGVGILFFGLA